MKFRKIVVMALLPLTLMSCNKKKAEAQAADLLKNLDKTATHVGIDSNNNGIRDDIEDIIAKYPNTSAQEKKAMRQVAKAMQSVQSTTQSGKMTKEKAYEIAEGIMEKSRHCLTNTFLKNGTMAKDPDTFDKWREASKLLEAINHNTELRAKSYIDYNVLLNDTIGHSSKGNTCDF